MAHACAYPARVKRVDEEVYLVDFPDFPEANTFGTTEIEAIQRASDALREALRSRMEDREEIPDPSPVGSGLWLIYPPAEIAAKVAVYEAFRRRGLTQTALAEQLGVGEAEVRRILDPSHRTKLGRLDEVAQVLGGRLEVVFVPNSA